MWRIFNAGPRDTRVEDSRVNTREFRARQLKGLCPRARMQLVFGSTETRSKIARVICTAAAATIYFVHREIAVFYSQAGLPRRFCAGHNAILRNSIVRDWP